MRECIVRSGGEASRRVRQRARLQIKYIRNARNQIARMRASNGRARVGAFKENTVVDG